MSVYPCNTFVLQGFCVLYPPFFSEFSSTFDFSDTPRDSLNFPKTIGEKDLEIIPFFINFQSFG